MTARAAAAKVSPAIALVAMALGVLMFTAVVSPGVWSLMASVGWEVRFSRVYNRVFEIGLVVAIALGWRRWDFGHPRDWGFTADHWRGRLATGVVVGSLGLGVGLGLAWLGDGLVPDLRYAPLKTVRKAATGLVGAVIVALGEEALFRGLLLRRFRADLGPRGGFALATGLYAVVHALRGAGVAGPVDWTSGWAHTAALFAPLSESARLSSVMGLAALGSVLGWARLREGIWVAVGIHASWVAVFRVGRLLFDIRQRPIWLVGGGWPPLVGGVAGLTAVAVVAVALVLRAQRRRRDSSCHPVDGVV